MKFALPPFSQRHKRTFKVDGSNYKKKNGKQTRAHKCKNGKNLIDLKKCPLRYEKRTLKCAKLSKKNLTNVPKGKSCIIKKLISIKDDFDKCQTETIAVALR